MSLPMYQNPSMMYGNPYTTYQPQPNPYLDKAMNGFQANYPSQVGTQMPLPNSQVQIQQQTQGVPCRIVSDFSQITANDVPMDGNGAFFIKNDGSELQRRVWSGDGSIQSIIYKPYKPEIGVENQNQNILSPEEEKAKFEAFEGFLTGISAKVDAISERLDEISAKKPGRVKKEVEEE